MKKLQHAQQKHIKCWYLYRFVGEVRGFSGARKGAKIYHFFFVSQRMPGSNRAQLSALFSIVSAATHPGVRAGRIPCVTQVTAPNDATAPSATALRPEKSHLTWQEALCEMEGLHEMSVPVRSAVALHEFLTSEAKKLGCDAAQRGELRRRAGVFCAKDNARCPWWSSGVFAGDDSRVNGRKLKDVLVEEMEGCRAWATECIQKMGSAAGIDQTRCALKPVGGAGEPFEEICGAVACFAGEESGVVESFALASVLLNHLRPMRRCVVELARDAWGEALNVCEQFLNSDDAISSALGAELFRCVASVAPSNSRVKLLSLYVHQRRNQLLSNLKDLPNLFRFCSLRCFDEEELLNWRRKLREQMQAMLDIIREMDALDVERAQEFKRACSLGRRAAVNMVPAGGYSQEHHGSHSNRSSFSSPASFSRNMEKRGCGVECEEGKKSVQVREISAKGAEYVKGNVEGLDNTSRSGNRFTSSEMAVVSSCWQRTALETWRKQRGSAIRMLCSQDGKEAKEGGQGKQFRVELGHHEACRVDVAEGPHRTPLSRLRATISGGCKDYSDLLTALCSWVRENRRDLNETCYMTFVLEIVVFIFVCELRPSVGVAALSQLTSLLVQFRKEQAVNNSVNLFTEPLTVGLAAVALRTSMEAARRGTVRGGIAIDPEDVGNSPFLKDVAALLFEVRLPHMLRQTVSILRDGYFTSPLETIGAPPPLGFSNEFYQHTGVIAVLVRMAACRNMRPTVSPDFPTVPIQPVAFLIELTEVVGESAILMLREIPLRRKKPIPGVLNEALWGLFVPFAAWLLHNGESLAGELPVDGVRRLLKLCEAVVADLAARWNHSVVPTRRRWISMEKPVVSLFTQEYVADEVTRRKVVSFASLLEGILSAALRFFPNIFSEARGFSRVCSAVAIILHDVDTHTAHQIMEFLLRLSPPPEQMDCSAHHAVVRCLSAMRHGCTLWMQAVHHYTQTLRTIIRDEEDASVTASKRSRVSADVSTSLVLRCVGSSNAPRAVRCMLTLRIAALASAAGISLNAQSLVSCMHNFVMRRSQPNGIFNGVPWCDVLGWHSNLMTRARRASWAMRDVQFLHAACLQALLAQGEWPEALLLLPRVEIPFANDYCREGSKTGTRGFKSCVMSLLALCASDRTRSCRDTAATLIEMVRRRTSEREMCPTWDGTVTKLCQIACVEPPIYRGRDEKSRTPLFRDCAPSFPQPAPDAEGELLIRLGSTALSYNHPRYSHEALVKRLEARVARLRSEVAVTLAITCTGTEEPQRGHEGEKHCRPSLIRVCERTSVGLHRSRVVWSQNTLMREETDPSRARAHDEAARSLLDTRLASVMVPLRRLERIRAEKHNRHDGGKKW